MKKSSDIPNRITRDMTVLDALSRYSETEAVFRRYDALAGECICCRALFDTLENMASKYNLDLEELMSNLRDGAQQACKKQISPCYPLRPTTAWRIWNSLKQGLRHLLKW